MLMKRSVFFHSSLIVSAIGLLLLQGCSRGFRNKLGGSSSTSVNLGKLLFTPDGDSNDAGTGIPFTRVHADSGVGVEYYGIPNSSIGAFTSQTTVAFKARAGEPPVGLVSGTSRAMLEYVPHSNGEDDPPAKYYISAVYDAAIDGFDAVVFTDGFPFSFDVQQGSSVAFPSTHWLDLQIQRTDTQLIFSARKPTTSGTTNAWTQVTSINVPMDSNSYQTLIGMKNVPKGGQFYYGRFAQEGEGTGGVVEGPIINQETASVDAIHFAQAKMNPQSPDAQGAASDLDTAITQNDDAINALTTALNDNTLESTSLGDKALKTLQAQAKNLTKAKTALAKLSARNAKAQIRTLSVIAGAQEAAIADLIGLPAPNLKSAPPLVSLHVQP